MPAIVMTEELVNIEVNGQPLKARKGQMIMQATDPAGIYIPRFCYHEKLSIAANCRMCLVEVEKAPKPMPGCATPVAEGMKIFTRSPKAIAAQRATMEFLLINHPLDCPICDQGGECELQDLAMGFGRDIARFSERKRVVKDKNLGPLVSTDMTRCIHCTRCVRFGAEIAGIPELGATGRGEDMLIGTYIEKSVDHELSGNIIDLCPVGALNSKPFRFRARAWEMTQAPLVSPHDGVGTNLYGHVLRGRLMRVVPRANEEINETWIADRDRFSYEGIYSDDRLQSPMIREGGKWTSIDWDKAITVAAEGLQSVITRHGADALGVLASPSATLEELHLVARLARGLGSANIDHRLRRRDFRDQAADPIVPSLGVALADIDRLQSILVVGSNLRREMPLVAHRIRKAALAGARVAFVNPREFEYRFPVAAQIVSDSAVKSLGALVRAAAQKSGKSAPDHVDVSQASVGESERALIEQLMTGERRAIFVGALALRHAAYSEIRALTASLAELTGATLGFFEEGANAVGAHLAGVLPHRGIAGKALPGAGLDARGMIESPRKAYLLFGGIEPKADCGSQRAVDALTQAEFVVMCTPFLTEELKRTAHVLLPIGSFAETSGTFVSLEGRWQSFAGAAQPLGSARPGWKVLRVLGNVLNLAGFEYQSSEEVRDEIRKEASATADHRYTGRFKVNGGAATSGTVDVPMYQIDAILRRAPALQKTLDGQAQAAVY
jgi:NADH-quinone oxidoreductase subunit G